MTPLGNHGQVLEVFLHPAKTPIRNHDGLAPTL
jgi:hypothetical protein